MNDGPIPAPEAAWQPPVRPEFSGKTAYGAPQLDVAVALNVNENPYPPSGPVAAAITAQIAEVVGGLNRYPERDARALRTALAGYVRSRVTPASSTGDFNGRLPGLDGDWIWPANGSNEVMAHILTAYAGPGRTMLTFPPTYSMYPEYALVTHTTLTTVPRRAAFDIDLPHTLAVIAEQRPDVVMVTSPNNPTGTAIALAELTAIVAAAPGIVVVDEAYAEFARNPADTALSLLATHRNVIVVRTMSKAFALAGVRLGYAVAHPEVIAALRVVRLPYHLSALTQAAATAALAHTDDLLADVAVLREERDLLVSWLRSCGLAVADSDANFVLFGRFADRHAVWQHLLDLGVLIRETGPDGWLRVSIGTRAENAAFRAALQDVLTRPGVTVLPETPPLEGTE